MTATPPFATADLSDAHDNAVRIVAPGTLHNYGGHSAFSGPVTTIQCHEDNSRVREAVAEPGTGRVLVVDGGGSLNCALLGDQLAVKAVDNGWHGIVVWGCVRDTAILATLPLGVRARAACPRKSIKRGRGERDVAVRLVDTACTPGMHLYADQDGIIIAAGPLSV